MQKVLLIVMIVFIITGNVLAQDIESQFIPRSELIDQGPVKEDFSAPSMKTKTKTVFPAYVAPPHSKGVYTGIISYWDYMTNGGALEWIEVNPDNPNKIHTIMMVGTDSGSTAVISASRRTAYNYSDDGGSTWGTPQILNKGAAARSGYPNMTIEKIGAEWVTDVVNHAVHPTPGDEDNPLATALSLQQGEGQTFGDAIPAPYQFDTQSPIWPTVKVAPNGNIVILAGRQSPLNGSYITVYKPDETWLAWIPLDSSEGGARSAMALGSDGRIAAGWFAGPGGIESYTMRYSVSKDNGLTWSAPDSMPKETNGYVYFAGFDMMYADTTLFIASCGGYIEDGSVRYVTSRIRIWDKTSNTVRIAIDSANFPFLKKTASTSQRSHGYSFHQPSISYAKKGGLTRILVAASVHQQGVVDAQNWHYSDIIYTYSDNNGTTWSDVKNLTRSQDIDERYVALSNYSPVINDSIWMYLGFMEDKIPGHNLVVSDGDNRPVSKAAWKFMRINTDYVPAKDLVMINTDFVNWSGIPAVGVPETVKVIIKNDAFETNPSSVTITYKANSFPANENDGTKQVFTPVWGGLGGKYANLTFTQTYSPTIPGPLTIYTRIFYTGDEDPSSNDGKRTKIIVPPKDLALSKLAQQQNTLIYPKSAGTPYIPGGKLDVEILNMGGQVSNVYEFRWTLNKVAQPSVGRPVIPYAKKDSFTVNFTPAEIGTYDIKAWPIMVGDTTKTNDTLALKYRVHRSHSFSICYDDSTELAGSMWGTDSSNKPLTSGVRFTAPKATKLLAADIMFTSTNNDTTWGDTVLVAVRQSLNDSAAGDYIWQKRFSADEYIVKTNAAQWVSFPIDQEILIGAGQDFWIQISWFAIHTKLDFPQAVDYYAKPYKLWNAEGNRSFFSEDTGKTWHALRENYWWEPINADNEIMLRNKIRAICSDETLDDVVSVKAGWNMVSLPMRRTDKVTTIFPTTSTPRAFAYTATGYEPKDTMKAGPGYWLKFPGVATAKIFGGFIYDQELDVIKGWNMIGSVSDNAAVASVTTTPPGIVISSYYGYDAGYNPATEIKPGLGYWVKVSQNGKLKINTTTMQKAENNLAADLTKFNSIAITDKNKNSQVLYFGEDTNGEFPIDMFEMPPVPPVEAFDVRFASQRMVETYPSKFEGQKEYSINLSSNEFPVTISWNLVSQTKGYSIGSLVEGKVIGTSRLTGESGSIKINNATSLTLKIDADGGLPTEYALGQNYPNPFNPSTKFQFAMPKDAHVEVVVYDILGSKVTTLFEGNKEAGYHSIEWNGKNDHGHVVPSGVYFVKMTSDGFSAVRKALMLK